MPQDPFVTHCLELLAPLGPARSRRMFGGHGFYVDDVFVALIAADRLYVKTDPATVERFRAAGCTPFVYDGKGKPVSTGYWTLPDEALDAPPLALPWLRLAMEAALRARNAKTAPRGRRRRPAAPGSAADKG